MRYTAVIDYSYKKRVIIGEFDSLKKAVNARNKACKINPILIDKTINAIHKDNHEGKN